MRGSNRPLLKKHNEASIKEVIYKYGPVCRSEIAEILSLTPPTITTNITAMIQSGLVYECNTDPKGKNSLGRKPIMIDFVANARYVAGVELGPYQTMYCMLDLRGNEICHFTRSSASDHYDCMVNEIEEGINQLWKISNVPTERILGVGIGLPGFIDGQEGVIRSNYRADWNSRKFADDLAQKINLPIRIQNNVRVRAIGAGLLDARVNAENFAYYFISQGIACPLMINSSILLGETSGAGEVGHMVMDVKGPKCEVCGNNGCLDAISSERAIRRRTKQAIAAGLYTILTDICQEQNNPRMEEIMRAQKAGDRVVCSIVNEAVFYLGIALANIINLISPQLVLIDGYIMTLEQNRDLLLDTTKKNVFGLNSKEVRFEFIHFDTFRGARGAAALAIKELFINS